MANHFAIMFNFKGSPTPPTAALEEMFTRTASDWLRFSSHCYVVHYNGAPSVLNESIKPLLHKDDSVLILDTTLANRSGWASPMVVTWLKKYVP